jgi:hypothetical protein
MAFSVVNNYLGHNFNVTLIINEGDIKSRQELCSFPKAVYAQLVVLKNLSWHRLRQESGFRTTETAEQ